MKSNSNISVDTKDFENPAPVSMVYSTVYKNLWYTMGTLKTGEILPLQTNMRQL